MSLSPSELMDLARFCAQREVTAFVTWIGDKYDAVDQRSCACILPEAAWCVVEVALAGDGDVRFFYIADGKWREAELPT